MKTQNKKLIKHSYSLIKTLLVIFLLIEKTKNSQSPNFAGKQNPIIDMIHSHIPGNSLYFKEKNNQTLIIFNIYPDSSLNFNFKIYSNISSIQQTFVNSNRGIIFGMDFNYNSTDVSVKDFRGDGFFCFLNIDSTSCDDYFWDFAEKRYVRNTSISRLGYVLLNSLIPNGFNSTDGTYFDSNVIDFNYYFGLKVIKDYPPGFDVFSMFRWLYIVSQNKNWNVTVLYGLQNSKGLSNFYQVEDLTFFKEVQYIDGNGLEAGDNFLSFSLKFFFICIALLLL